MMEKVLIFNVVLIFLSFRTIEAGVRLVPEESDIFSDCQGKRGVVSINDRFDLSSTGMEYKDDGIEVSGDAKVTWDLKETDRVEMSTELFKFQRGTWQPTFFSASSKDFCKDLLDTDSMYFKGWMTHVKEADRKCFSKGHVYHHEPFTAGLQLDGDINMSGTHKAVTILKAFDANNKQIGPDLCVEIRGEIEQI